MNRSHLLFREVLDVSADEWLESHVYLSREVSPNAPGNLSLAGQPWAREILRTIASPYSREIELVMGAQTGKTTILLLAWLLFARFQPQPCLHVIDWGSFHSYSSARGQHGCGWFVSSTTYGPADDIIDVAIVDSGFQTMEVYNECASFPGMLIPSKGTTASVGVFGLTNLRDAPIPQLITYKDFSLKKSIEEMKLDKRIVLPCDITEDFLAGISGQTLIRTGGKYAWKDLKEDHFNDCLKLCLLASWIFAPEAFLSDLQSEPEPNP